MSFGGFYGNTSGGDARIMADNPYNSMSRAAIVQHQLLISSSSQPIFNSQALSLSIKPKMEGLGRMGLLGEAFEGGLLGRGARDGSASRSGSDNLEGAPGDDHGAPPLPTDKRQKQKYHRHTPQQIQELESAFKENPHPDEKERLALGEKLNLESKQIKFWFQNRRTQMKTHLERHENTILKQDNDKLKIENIALKEAIRKPVCNNCGGQAILGELPIDEHHIRIENARLRDEINRMSILANKLLGRPLSSLPNSSGVGMPNSSLELAVGRNGFGGGSGHMDLSMQTGLDFGNGLSNGLPLPLLAPNRPAVNDVQYEKTVFLDLALAAMDELLKLGQIDTGLWFGSIDGVGEALNLDEYSRTFVPCIGITPNGFVSEGSRATGMVIASSLGLVEMLIDPDQWVDMFPGLIGRCISTEVLYPGSGDSRSGYLLLMQVELQVISPLVPLREVKFVRFCKQHAEGVWAVVDLSIDALRESSSPHSFLSCRRLPSGCILQDMPNGGSKVTWIEHSEYDETGIHHLYRPLFRSGLGFSAQRWLSALQRHCECIASTLSLTSPTEGHAAISPGGKRSLLKLAKRMTQNFCAGVCANSGHNWEVVQVSNSVEVARIMVRKGENNTSDPMGLVLSATMSVWMPISHQRLFSLLLNEDLRSQWDVLSRSGPLQQMVHVPKAQDQNNCVSLLRPGAGNGNQANMVILQDTAMDASGSLVVYVAVDASAINVVMNGGDSSCVAFLPSGFAIVPDCVPDSGGAASNGRMGSGSEGGSLLTIGFQILVNKDPLTKLTIKSVETVNALIARTIQGIKDAILSNQHV